MHPPQCTHFGSNWVQKLSTLWVMRYRMMCGVWYGVWSCIQICFKNLWVLNSNGRVYRLNRKLPAMKECCREITRVIFHHNCISFNGVMIYLFEWPIESHLYPSYCAWVNPESHNKPLIIGIEQFSLMSWNVDPFAEKLTQYPESRPD